MINSESRTCSNIQGRNKGQLCRRCEGGCPSCGSFVGGTVEARICDNCFYELKEERCIKCLSRNITRTAYYCRECVSLEKDRDGCPRIINPEMNIINSRK
jgi:PHD finger-like domain-containing protein 5A